MIFTIARRLRWSGLVAGTLVLAEWAPLAAQERPTRVAQLPAVLPGALDSLRAPLIDSLVLSWLIEARYDVIPHDSTASAWKRAMESVGGIYDSVTGKLDSARVAEARRLLGEEIRSHFNADAVLSVFADVVGVKFHGGKAKWDGIEEKTGAAGGLGGEMFGTKEGTLRGLTLVARVRDVDQKVLHEGRRGLQLVDKVRGNSMAHVPVDSLLVNPAQLQEAVKLVLAELPKKVPPTRKD